MIIIFYIIPIADRRAAQALSAPVHDRRAGAGHLRPDRDRHARDADHRRLGQVCQQENICAADSGSGREAHGYLCQVRCYCEYFRILL